MTSGYPTNDIIELAWRATITLVPIDGPIANAIAERFNCYSTDTIPAGNCKRIGAVRLHAGAERHYREVGVLK